MSGNAWTKIYWSDFLGDTLRLTQEEIGAYFLLLADYYQREQPLPGDKSTIYRVARANSKTERASVDRVLKEYFIYCDGQWWNKRADKEIASRRKQRENGAKGGRPPLKGIKGGAA